MDKLKPLCKKIASLLLVLGFVVLFPMAAAEATSAMSLEEAKIAIEQARKAGAEQRAADDLSSAMSWFAQAEKTSAEAKSIMSVMSTAKTKKAKEDEIIFLATMAKLKAMVAEAKTRKGTTIDAQKATQKDLADNQSVLSSMRKKMEEVEKARANQAKAEAERKQIEEAKRRTTEMEAQAKKELAESQRKAAELTALKDKELQEARLKEAQRAAEAKKKAEQLASESKELKAREEKLSAEKQTLDSLQAKVAALEREKTMLSEIGAIPRVSVTTRDKKIIITVLVINLFTPTSDLTTSGRETLDGIGNFLKAYPNHKVEVWGHTDSQGKSAMNQALSEKRAKKVREYLVANQNIPPARITAKGAGSAEPVATNANEAGRALNRRVEITILPEE